jgi:hypothetical protein
VYFCKTQQKQCLKNYRSRKEERKEALWISKGDIDSIFERIDNAPKQHHLLYQLPTGGGKRLCSLKSFVAIYLQKK